MWVDSVLSWGSFIIFMTLLILIYIKKADREENYIRWKIIGYYLLGTFMFRFDSLVLPVGIVIFLLFFLPKLNRNKQAKKWAAYLGLGAFLSGIVISQSVEAFYERNVQVKASSANAYEMKFYEDYEKVKSALKAEGELSLIGLQLEFNKKGKIEHYQYSAYYTRDGKNMSANIQSVYSQGEDKLSIFPNLQQEEDFINTQHFISSPQHYFKALDQHNIQKMVPEGDRFHVEFSNDGEVTASEENISYWDIQKSGIVKQSLEQNIEQPEEGEEPPAFPYHIHITSMKDMGGGSYTGTHNAYFNISPELYE